MDEQEALAICFANLKGSRDKELLKTAEALRFLKGLPPYRSNRTLGHAVGVSGEIVREFLSLLDLPLEVRELLHANRLGLEQGRRLVQLSRSRPRDITEAGRAMVDLTATDSRYLAEQLIKYADVGVSEAREKILGGKTVTRREFHVIARLDETDYRVLKAKAEQEGQPVDEVVTKIVQDWLRVKTK